MTTAAQNELDAFLNAGWTLCLERQPGDGEESFDDPKRYQGNRSRRWSLVSPDGNSRRVSDASLVRASAVIVRPVAAFAWRAVAEPDSATLVAATLSAARQLGRLTVSKVGKSAVKEISDAFVSAQDWDDDEATENESRLADEFVGGVMDSWPDVGEYDARLETGKGTAPNVEASLVQLVDVFEHIGFAFAAEPGRSVPVAEAITANAQAIEHLGESIEAAGRFLAKAIDGREGN